MKEDILLKAIEETTKKYAILFHMIGLFVE